EGNGYFSGLSIDFETGARYGIRLDDEARLFPDPASRFQPDGPEGFSEIVDPLRYRWSDERWKGLRAQEQVLYEMHIGTFTREGTWEASAAELPGLARLGTTALEIMPAAEFHA